VCDLETSRMGAPYIYDISRLRVKCQEDCRSAFAKYQVPDTSTVFRLVTRVGETGSGSERVLVALHCYVM